ncbi:MAG: 3-hydroxydecanoyl-[ACP] dehydratase [Ramlibacter sp.]|jgi:predicted hotdog family 3-hydroxylacyl-ACP dehydratase|uniref:hydroxymyristoyl-ACP dehydratase n=1 Tax=Ramlibacter sp. TaxID=1917967 RepID=UPI00260E69D9|nr:hydroxymyristoyl-ACP dehydratase [Ramlibacter sp.]MDB5749671.1 3-hydroxydecanoyl-[ACP] dehydratase [Ramlibacter sp.]
MKIDRTGIEGLVPHAGAMCLLDAVTEWSEQEIACTSALPAAGHPLARDGRVPAIAAIEYAAQATAVHGALLERSDGPRAGMLATLVDVRLELPQIPTDGEALSVRAALLSRSAGGCLYSFVVGTRRATIASGRLLVALRAGQPA